MGPKRKDEERSKDCSPCHENQHAVLSSFAYISKVAVMLLNLIMRQIKPFLVD